jgi:hypothetical protein
MAHRHGGFFFLFFSILWCNHTDNHPQEELAKFGYNSERKVEIFKNCTTFWQLIGTYCPWPEDTILEFLEPDTPTVVVCLSVHPSLNYEKWIHTMMLGTHRFVFGGHTVKTASKHARDTQLSPAINSLFVFLSVGRWRPPFNMCE